MINLYRKCFFIILLTLFTLSVFAEEAVSPFILTADSEILLESHEKLLIARGNACFEMDDILVKADKITVLSSENLLLAEGDGLTIKIGGQIFEGSRLEFNYQSMTGSIEDINSKINELSLSGSRISMVKTGNYEIDQVQLTPCRFPEPHYSITAKKVIVYPGDRITASSVWFNFAGHKVFYLPSYTMKYNPQTGSFENISLMPELGYRDGIYLKIVYPYEFSKDFSGEIKGEINQNGDKNLSMENKYILRKDLSLLNSYLYEYIIEDDGDIAKKNEMRIGLNYQKQRIDIYTGIKKDLLSESIFYELDGKYGVDKFTFNYFNEFKDNEINKENYSIKYNSRYPVELVYKKGYTIDYLPYLKISGLDYNYRGLNIRSSIGIGKSANKDIVSNKSELELGLNKEIIKTAHFDLKWNSLFKANYYQLPEDDKELYSYYRLGFTSTYHDKFSENVHYKIQLGYNQRQDNGYAYLPEDRIESTERLKASIGLSFYKPEEFSAWHLHLDSSYELEKQSLDELSLILNRELDCYDYYIGLDLLDKKLEFGINF